MIEFSGYFRVVLKIGTVINSVSTPKQSNKPISTEELKKLLQ